jgi:hypothetical protein
MAGVREGSCCPLLCTTAPAHPSKTDTSASYRPARIPAAGDLGRIVAIHHAGDKLRVSVAFPPRPGAHLPHEVDYEGRQKLQELQLAWATTVHKVGGSCSARVGGGGGVGGSGVGLRAAGQLPQVQRVCRRAGGRRPF